MAKPQSPISASESRELCIHIFYVSAGMVGVCLTVMGLVQVVVSMRNIETIMDELLAADALLFLIACLVAYWALRRIPAENVERLLQIADGFFVAAIVLMLATSCFITYELVT